jgi:hypothetical protein
MVHSFKKVDVTGLHLIGAYIEVAEEATPFRGCNE